MQKVADLHVHTNVSDGSFSPEEIVRYAESKGLSALSITDHDSCDAIEPAMAAAEEPGMEIIPGVELTAELSEGEEIHVLGYFIDWKDKEFSGKLRHIADVRRERAKKIIIKLREHGIDVSEQELLDFSGGGSIGRLDIAHLLLKKGAVSSTNGAFVKYIGNNGPCYVKKFKLSPGESVELIKSVGGVAVLAHPKTVKARGKTTEEIVETLVRDGIRGIEVYHSDHKESDVKRLRKMAEKYNLLTTGGSDCHGTRKREILTGKVKIPYELVEKLRQAAGKG